MVVPPLLFDQKHDWFKTGSRRMDFFSTSRDMQRWVAALPERFAPYELLGVEKGILDTPFSYELDSLALALDERVNPSFWIRSAVLTPTLEVERGKPIAAIYSLNGLIDVSLSNTVGPRGWPASWAGVLIGVRNVETGEVRDYPGYEDLFGSLKKLIVRDLVYSSVQVGCDGTAWVPSERWTEDAVRDYEEHNRNTEVRPGPRLEGKPHRTSR